MGNSYYKYIESTTQIKTEPSLLSGIFVSEASSTPTITIYDSATFNASDPVVVATFTPSANTNYQLNGSNGIITNKGLYVVISGTVKCTIFSS